MNVLLIGGSSGLGLSILHKLINDEKITKIILVDKISSPISDKKLLFIQFNVFSEDISTLVNNIDIKINVLIYTAGVGRLDFFSNIDPVEINQSFIINTITPIKLINYYKNILYSNEKFYSCIISSISGLISSPLYSLYSSTKASLSKFIESVNVELEYLGFSNRILDVCPGSIKGTSFKGDETNLSLLSQLSDDILFSLFNQKNLLIPDYEKIYKKVISDYTSDSKKFGLNSLKYKLENNKLETKPKYKVGYLSGTFDLFHIGHLNLIINAKKNCDYLIVGVHRDGSHKKVTPVIAYEERKAIIQSLKFVDLVIESMKEDIDVLDYYHYDFLFVGSDYKGSERFNRYEKILQNTSVKIIYFQYTTTTSSTILRNKLE
jgi:cytidyltransferase-like protein